MKKKSLALIMAIVMVFGVTVGATFAYLFDKTETITNTFTIGNIDIALAETDAVEGEDGLTKDFKMVPGNTIAKDPVVTVKAGSEDCYLFVKIEKSATLDDYITYAVAEGWTALEGNEGVYYREVAESTADVTFSVLAGDEVTVKGEVTKEMMEALEAADAVQPTLAFTAYACQSANLTVEQAWAEVTK